MTASSHLPGGGDSRPASAAAPVSASAREGAAQPMPRTCNVSLPILGCFRLLLPMHVGQVGLADAAPVFADRDEVYGFQGHIQAL